MATPSPAARSSSGRAFPASGNRSARRLARRLAQRLAQRLAHGPARWLAPLLVALLTAAAFLPSLHNGFVAWDDDKNFLSNLHYRGLAGSQLAWMWGTFHLGHWVPLTWMSLGLDYTLWGMHPAGYHAVSLALHAANAVLLYLVAERLYRAVAAPARTIPFAAVACALLFAVHPLRVESVAWVTERRDVLSGFFYLCAVFGWLRFAEGGPRARRCYGAALVAFACALLSKATAVTLPVVLVILDVYPLGRTSLKDAWWTPERRQWYRGLLPFALLALAAGVVALLALQGEAQLPLAGKVAVSAYGFAFYLWKTLLPVGLSPLYAMPAAVDPLAGRYLLGYGTVMAAVAVAWVARRRAPGVTAALAAFTVMLLPLLGVHQNGPQIVADRYAYNASMALALLGGALLLAVPRAFVRPVATAAAVALAALGARTWQQTLVWRDSRSLWEQVLRVEPDSPIAHNNLANVLMQDHEMDAAFAHYSRALALDPDYAEAHDNVGVVLARRGRYAEAIAEHERALLLDPTRAGAHNNWGVVLSRQGAHDDAIAHFRSALRLNPEYADAYVNWGNALGRVGRPDEAIGQYRAAIAVRPDDADARHNWGVTLAQQGKYAEAVEQFRQVLAIQPDHAESRAYLDRATKMLRTPD